MDIDGAVEDLLAEVPAEEAPSEASCESEWPPDMDADIDVSSLPSHFETAAGIGRAIAPDDVLVEDFGEPTWPSTPEGAAQGANSMGAED